MTASDLRELPEANRRAEGYTPLCGDKAAVFLNTLLMSEREVSVSVSPRAIPLHVLPRPS